MIEKHGADIIPKTERTKRWWDMFVMLAAINICLSGFMLGGIVVPSLSLWAACGAYLIGNVILAILMALMGYIGVDCGVSGSVASRFSLGYPMGTWFSSLCILISLTGWFAVHAELSGLVIDNTVKSLTGFSSPTLFIVLVGTSNAITAIIGFECIKWMSRLSVPFLLALCVWILVVIGKQYDLGSLLQYVPTRDISFTGAIDLVVGGLILGVFIASDITRYIRSRTDSWFGAILGILPAASFLAILGSISSLATGDWNPVNAVIALGMGLPALAIIFFATWTTNDSNLYSAGLALTNVFPKLTRWQNTLILSTAGTILAALRITNHFQAFLELLAYAFSPLVGIVMCDYFLIRRGQVELDEAYQVRGRFYYSGGVNMVAWIVAAAGFFIALFLQFTLLKSLTTIFASGVLYYVGMRLFHPTHFYK
jgi:NCS1 nucleoside transporter family